MEPIYVKLHFERSCTPTLQMAKTWLKRRLFDDRNDVYWMGFGLGLMAQSGRVLANTNGSTRARYIANHSAKLRRNPPLAPGAPKSTTASQASL